MAEEEGSLHSAYGPDAKMQQAHCRSDRTKRIRSLRISTRWLSKLSFSIAQRLNVIVVERALVIF